MCRGCAGEEDWGLNLMDDLDDIAYEKVREARARLGRVRAAAKKMKDPKKKKEKGKEGKEAKGGMGLNLLFGGILFSCVYTPLPPEL